MFEYVCERIADTLEQSFVCGAYCGYSFDCLN
jgi:hypothetical protein